MLSSSTARPESPNFYIELQEKFMKRLRRDGTIEEQEEEVELSRPTKRRKNASATPTRDDDEQTSEAVGTQNQPVEISSAESSLSTSQPEAAQELTQAHPRQDVFETLDDDVTRVENEEQEAEKEVESIESDVFPHIDQLPLPPLRYETVSDDDLPSNTPTPRPNRQKVSNFDTQAILSSPIQDPRDRLSQPQGYAQNMMRFHQNLERSLSPAQEPASDASTTQSLQEFRRSLNAEDIAQLSYPHFPPQNRLLSPSPAPSSTSSTSTESGDPDPPLSADEIDDFFNEQNAQGFSNDFISAALKRTRLRPGLAVRVLDAWKFGAPLPHERGIWSVQDDVAVESGDGVELAKLERKHSTDGWGGITERLVFLEGYRNR
jgi:hypothetical protein